MATVFKRGDIWYARFSKDGRVVVKSTKQTEREKAEVRMQELLANIKAQDPEVNMEERPTEEKRPRKARRATPKLVKLNGIWYIRIRKEGKYSFMSTKQKDKISADKIFQQFLNTGEMPPIEKRTALRQEKEGVSEGFRKEIVAYLKLISRQLSEISQKLEFNEPPGAITSEPPASN